MFVRDISVNKKGWVSLSLISQNTNIPVIEDNENNIIVTSSPPNCDYNIISPNNGEKG